MVVDSSFLGGFRSILDLGIRVGLVVSCWIVVYIISIAKRLLSRIKYRGIFSSFGNLFFSFFEGRSFYYFFFLRVVYRGGGN